MKGRQWRCPASGSDGGNRTSGASGGRNGNASQHGNNNGNIDFFLVEHQLGRLRAGEVRCPSRGLRLALEAFVGHPMSGRI